MDRLAEGPRGARDMDLPSFKYHPDPIASGSVRAGPEQCRCCRKARGLIYVGPVYSEKDGLEESLCPWCIADGQANAKFAAEFHDVEAIAPGASGAAVAELTRRTPGFAEWQSVEWPVCCGDLMKFLEPAGIEETRRKYYTVEGQLMGVIVHEMGISGGAAVRLLQSLHRDRGPTAFIFKCQSCDTVLGKIDGP